MFKKCIAVIEELTNTKISQLLFHHQKSVVNQLLFNYQRDPDKVLFALQNVISGSGTRESKEQMVRMCEEKIKRNGGSKSTGLSTRKKNAKVGPWNFSPLASLKSN